VEKVRSAITEIVSKQEKKVQEEEVKRKKAATENSATNGPTQNSVEEQPHIHIQMEVDPKHHRHFIMRGAG
jgi:hypothetical protein